MADGKITFDTALDNRQLEKELESVQRKITKALEAKGTAEAKQMPLLEQSRKLGAELDNAKSKLEALRAEAESIRLSAGNEQDPASYLDAYSRRADNAAEMAAQTKEVNRLQKEFDKINNKVDRYSEKLADANKVIEEGTAKVSELKDELEQSNAGIKTMVESAGDAAKAMERRLISIAKRVFVFQLITKVLRAAREYMGGLLEKNAEYQAELAKLRAALATAFQPLYDVALPILIKVLRILTIIAAVAANVLSWVFGKSLSQSAKNAKALNQEEKAIKNTGKAAEKASKQLAGFDELNILSDNAQESSAGLDAAAEETAEKMNFQDFELDEYKKKIDELTVYIGGALLALGAILAFSGANIPLGITLMAIGALAIASVVDQNWGAMSESLKEALTNVALVLGGAALVIGAALAFSGVNMPLGIALMAIGAAGLASAAALNWESIKQVMQGPVGAVVALISGELLVLGALMAFSGVNMPLGIALMAAGAAGLVSVGALNWNAIKEQLQKAWEGIKAWWSSSVAPKLTVAYWQSKLAVIGDGMKEAFRNGINKAIQLINRFISWVNNALHFSWSGLTIAGKNIIPAGSIRLANLPPIPMLAQGAVIPPNAPFMAMLGDQRNGNNIEAPEDLIRRIVREEAGNLNLNQEFTFDVNLDGLTVARKLYKYNRQVSAEHGMSLIESGGT